VVKVEKKSIDLIIMNHLKEIFCSYLKNNKIIKFYLQLNFHMKIFLNGQIDHLNFKNGEIIRNTWNIYM
jgi:hypothetical protein